VDDRPTGNANNDRANYARIDHICWDFAEQHEIMHALGAVQTSAPNATPGLHCSDEYDQMCYRDGSSVTLRYVCPAGYEQLFDCNHDDYFSTSPAPGSYLATHWNTANSDWLVGSPPPPSPPANDSFAAATALSGVSGSTSGTTVGATQESGEEPATSVSSPVDSVWHRWVAPADGLLLAHTCGSALDTTLGAWTGTQVNALTLVAGNDDDATGQCGTDSRVQLDVTAGSAYHLSVDGKGAAEGSFSLGWQFVPAGADLTAPLVQPAAASFPTPQELGSTVLVQVDWPDAADDSEISGYELQRRKGTRAWLGVSLPSPTSTSATLKLAIGKTWAFRVRATDVHGNTSSWATTPGSELALLQETASAVSYNGTFKRVAVTGASGGYVRRTAVSGRTATVAFNGRAIGFVTTVGPQRGIVEVRIDGGPWKQIDLYHVSLASRQIAWAEAPGGGTHTFEARVTGTRNASSSSARVDIDAFVVWR
jgi:hypothetical protein